MSLGKRACRHALQPSTAPLFDHVWVSDDFLTSTLRRFAHGQRRYESRVPGPLEARRRLAKRKNTALAGVAGSGPMDGFTSLFGKNGKQHLKWTTDSKSQSGTQDWQAFPPRPPDPPLPSYNEDNVTKSSTQYSWPETPSNRDPSEHEQRLDEYMEDHWMIPDIKAFVGGLGINVFLEPAYSRKIFRRLLAHSLHEKAALTEALAFLDDASLNARGSHNYAIAVEHLVSHETNSPTWYAFFNAVNRALSLGLVSSSELRSIVKSLSQMRIDVHSWPPQTALVGYYKRMWKAIGLCPTFNHRQLGMPVINAFLKALLKIGPHKDGLSLAAKIIVASHGQHSERRHWVPTFIIQWLLLMKSDPEVNGRYINQLLGHFHRRVVTEHVVTVTESLVSSSGDDKIAVLGLWRKCLFSFWRVPHLVQSSAWYNLRPSYEPGSVKGYFSNFSKSHQVILRLWVLRSLKLGLAKGEYWSWQTPDLAMSYLFDFYYYVTRESDTDHFLTLLMKGTRELGIPQNGLLIAAADLKTSTWTTNEARKYLAVLECGKATLADLFKRVHAYNVTSRYFHPSYDKLIRQVDITSPSFVEQSLHLLSTDGCKSAWLIIKLLRSHVPLHIAISMAWRPVPDASRMARVPCNRQPDTQNYMDPYAALEVLHTLAGAFSCSPKLSPRRAFRLVKWMYRFLKQHNAPIKPPLARALYHAGVVRYRHAGWTFPPGQYKYIVGIVRRAEDPVVLRSINMRPLISGNHR